jgi:hypothetical protein
VLVATVLVTACRDDDALSIDEAAVVDDGASSAAASLSGTADVSFDGVTASVADVTCSTESGFVVSPIVGDSFTLTVDGNPASDSWNVAVTQPGDPDVAWVAVAPMVDVDGDSVAGSAQMHRADDQAVTAALAFVVDC